MELGMNLLSQEAIPTPNFNLLHSIVTPTQRHKCLPW